MDALRYLDLHRNEIKNDKDPSCGDPPDVKKAELVGLVSVFF